jgi:MATE family multidrug resistance protein
MAGHDPAVRAHEVAYSRLLMLGAFPIVLMVVLSTFFTGRGDTRVVLLVNVLVTLVNGTLDYLWIFGHAGFPRGGVTGAALATIASQVVGSAVYFALILRPRFRESHATLSAWRFEPDLFGRLLRYGLPTGLQFSIEIAAFALFMLIVGRIGTAELAASSIAFNLNMIVFIPMLGLGVGVSSMVARYLGADDAASAERSTWSAFWLSLVYMAGCGAAYVLAPGPLLAPYVAGSEPGALAAVTPVATVLLRFVAVYSIFDMMNVIFAAGLKGAGDTRYPMVACLVLAWTAMLLPAYVGCVLLGGSVYVAWTAASAYVVLLGLLELRRFRGGRWRSLRIVEPGLTELDPLAARAEPA